jgi:transcriptional regulator with XRE-family HTH domain
MLVMTDRLPTVRTRKLGDELRRLREAAGYTLDQAGPLLRRSRATIGRIEQGLKVLTPNEVDYILNVYRIPPGEYRELLKGLAAGGRDQGWWTRYGRISPAVADRVSLEQDTRRIRSFQGLAVPGLLQTPAYARVILSSLPVEQMQDVDWLVNFRMARQRVLASPQKTELTAILAEGVIRQRLGDSEVMRGQLSRLRQSKDLANVSVRVLPFAAGTSPGGDGSFEIWDLASSALSLVVVDSLTRSLFLEDDSEVARYNVVFDELCAAALPEAESLALIEQVAAAL